MTEPGRDTHRTPGPRAIPGDVWTLGFVSMFMDISSEMIHSLLPIFLVSVLGAGATAVGVLEGIAEATVLVIKMFSGTLSDWLGKRKALTVLGYGIAALTKPLFPLASSYAIVFGARLVDRVGKGIRDAPRDALIADLAPEQVRGASYGLRQSLDTIGAVVGPLAAFCLMLVSGSAFRFVFWIAVAPAFVSVIVLAIFVHEPSASSHSKMRRVQLGWQSFRSFPPAFWAVVGIGAMFMLARFSEAFLVLRAGGLGLKSDYVPLVMVVMNVVYAASSYPAGRLSDRMDRRLVLVVSAAVLAAGDMLLAGAAGVVQLMGGIALWGLSLGLSQGLLAALVADAAPREQRGTAFGFFNLVSGAVILVSSILAGELWDRIGPPAPFYAGASFAGLALLGLLWQMRISPQQSNDGGASTAGSY